MRNAGIQNQIPMRFYSLGINLNLKTIIKLKKLTKAYLKYMFANFYFFEVYLLFLKVFLSS